MRRGDDLIFPGAVAVHGSTFATEFVSKPVGPVDILYRSIRREINGF